MCKKSATHLSKHSTSHMNVQNSLKKSWRCRFCPHQKGRVGRGESSDSDKQRSGAAKLHHSSHLATTFHDELEARRVCHNIPLYTIRISCEFVDPYVAKTRQTCGKSVTMPHLQVLFLRPHPPCLSRIVCPAEPTVQRNVFSTR